MERRTFIRKGTLASVAARISLISFGNTVRNSSYKSKDRNGYWNDRDQLPRDLEHLAGDSSLLKEPDDLSAASYVFPNCHPSAYT